MSFHLRTLSLFYLLLLLIPTIGYSQNACVNAGTGSVTYDGEDFADRPVEFYAPGTVVEICFSLDNDFSTPDMEWIHAVLIASVGPGFDYSTMAPSGTPPASCRAAGNWDWYPTWSRCITSCGTPTTFTNGYAFDSAEGTNDSCGDPPALDGNPGNNYGDGAGNCGLVFCWTFEALDPFGVPAADAYSMEVQVLADGVSGGYSGTVGGFCGSPCDSDPLICFPEIPDPEFTILNEPCPGELFQLQGGPTTAGVNPVWIDNADGSVVGTTYNVSLPEGSYTFALSKPGCAPKELEVDADLTIPVLDYLGPDDNSYLCHGDPLDMTISVTNATVNFIQWTLDGNPVSNTDSYSVAEVSVADAGAYIITVNYGDNCDTMFTVNLDVSPEILAEITPIDTSVCLFQSVTFMAQPPGGGSFPPEYDLSWDFGTEVGDSYTFDAFTVGVQTVTLTITDNSNPLVPCSQDFTRTYTVNELPGVTIDPLSSNICFGDSVTITATPSGGLPPYTYLWGPDNIVTTQTYTVRPPYSANLSDIYVAIRDANGCEEFSFPAEVILNIPPGQPLLSCTPICASELEFSWIGPGADFYAIYASINGGTEMLIDDNYTDNSYLFTGLNAGDEVDFRVVPFAGDLMMNCEGVDVSRECETPASSTPGFVTNFTSPICVGAGTSSFDLELYAGEAGTFTLSSLTLGLVNIAADLDSVTTIMLPNPPAGTNTAIHSIAISYEGIGGRCPSDTTIQVRVTQAPPADFTLNATEICGFTGAFTATLNTAATANDNYNLQLEDPIVGSVMPNGLGVWDITIDSLGTHSLILTTENSFDPSCVDTARAQVMLNPPLPAPEIVCGSVGLDFVTFSWNDTGADSYVVNEISIPAGGVVTQNVTSVTVTNLSVDDMVIISVTAVVAGCPDVTSAEHTCTAESCPDITIDIDDVGPFCDNLDQRIPLSITTVNSDGSGLLTWTLDGTAFNGVINPDSLGAGTYSIQALFDEGCDFFDVFQLQVDPTPNSSFDLPDGPICTDTDVLAAVPGGAQAGFTYQWTNANANVMPGADDASRNLSWSAPGRYFVSLVVTSDASCVAEVYTDSIDVVTPFLTPVIRCDTVLMESVTFAWDPQPGVDSFSVVVNGGTPFFQDSTTLFVGGLAISETVTIEVLPIGDTPCPLMIPGVGSCTTVPCPALNLERPADMDICEMEADPRTLLSANVTGDNGMGVLTFSGPGVIQVGPDYFFDSDTAGVGIHVLTVDFVEGMCTAQQTFTYTVLEKPTSDFNVNGLTTGVELCVGDIFTVTYTGSVTAATMVQDTVIFCWDYPDLVPIAVDTIGFQTYTCRFDQPGPFRICLVVKQDGCPSDTTYVDGICYAPLAPPVVQCTNTDLNSVTFSWTDVGGTEGYSVIRDGGAPVVTFDTEVIYTGLMPGEEVAVEVFANDSGPCNDGPSSGVVRCSTDPCPVLTPDLTSVPNQICILDGTEFISLSAITVNGGTGNGTYTFTGTGVARDTFFAAAVPNSETGVTYTISLDYVEEGPCSFSTTFDVIVYARPTAFFTDPGPQCVGDTFNLLIGSTNFVANADIVRDFDGATIVPDGDPDDNSYDLVYNAPGTYNLTATVNSNISGCPSLEAMLSIEVFAPLADPVVNCINPDLETVTFDWGPVPGATGYIFRGEDGSVVMLSDLETEHVVTGLLPSQTFTGTLQALGNTPCGNGMPVPVSCMTEDCPPGVIQSDTPPTEICLDGTQAPFLLAASLTVGAINGTVSWSGTGVVDNMDGTFSFDPTGLPSGNYDLNVNYDGPSNCDSDDQVSITLFDLPTVTLSPTPAQLCVGQTMTISFTGTAATGASFDWNFGDATVTDLGGESYELTWLTPGTKPVSLVVTDNCIDSTRFTVVVDPSLEIPQPTCAQQDLDAVVFSWPSITGASSYVVSVNGGATQTQVDTFLRIPGLDFGENVTITVAAMRTGTTCDLGPTSAAVNCAARTCPNITFNPAATQTTFCADETNSVLLEDNLSGDDGTGVLTWTGPGVVDNAGTYSFDPTLVGVGQHRLYVTYVQELLCSYTDSLDIEIFAVPTVSFSGVPTLLCQGEAFTVSFDGMAAGNATYNWDFDGANVTDLGGESYTLSWDTPGTVNVTLRVTDNCTAIDSFQIPVTPILAPPAPTCARQDLDGVLFEWAPVPGATVGYRVSIDGGPFGAPQTETSFFVSGLDFGENVSISVISVRDNTTCNESVPSTAVDCAARVCPTVTFTPAASQTTFCSDETNSVLLEDNLNGDDGTGILTWTGPGVVDNAGTFSFDPTLVGVGQHRLYVTYVQETLCVYTDSLDLEVFPVPTVAFNTIPAQLCEGEEFNVFFTGMAAGNATYTWNFDGAVVTDLGNESYLLRWDTPGTKTVTLRVEDECIANDSFMIPVTPTLQPPVPTCARQDLDGVLFEWMPVAAATVGYRISINGGPFSAPQTETSFFVSNLDFGENVTISVISVRANTTCNESAPSTAVNCAARVCPDVTMTPAAPQTSFCADETGSVPLRANLNGDDGTGTILWTGAGVIGTGSNFAFDPQVAGIGTHRLFVTYTQETLCTYQDSLEIVVNAIPSSSFVEDNSIICATGSANLRLVGNPDPAATYTWSFDGASVTDNGNENYDVRWSVAGPHEVVLTVTRNGCTSTAMRTIMVDPTVSSGTARNDVLEVCVSTVDPINLSSRISGATPGGTWSVVSGSGVANGSLDVNTGILNPSGLGAGDYRFAYSVAGGACPTETTEVDLRLLGAPRADAGPAQVLTCNMGMVSLNGSNSETGPGYTYLWTSNDPNIMITNADQMMVDVGQPGVYQLRVTNAIGCTATSEVTVTAETEAPVMELEISQITCFSSDNGAISVTSVTGGRPPYTYRC